MDGGPQPDRGPDPAGDRVAGRGEGGDEHDRDGHGGGDEAAARAARNAAPRPAVAPARRRRPRPPSDVRASRRFARALAGRAHELRAQPRQRALARAVLVGRDGLAQAVLNLHRAASPAGRAPAAGGS